MVVKHLLSRLCPLHNLDLLFYQPVKLVDQGVYMAVGGLYLALKERLLVAGPSIGELLVKGEHRVNKGNPAVVLCQVLRIGLINDRDRQLLNVNNFLR